MLEKYTAAAAEQALIAHNQSFQAPWELRDGKLFKQFIFQNFIEAFGFMAKVAILAEKANHHPEWCNVYNKVDISLMTHEVGAISSRDFDLMNAIESLAI